MEKKFYGFYLVYYAVISMKFVRDHHYSRHFNSSIDEVPGKVGLQLPEAPFQTLLFLTTRNKDASSFFLNIDLMWGEVTYRKQNLNSVARELLSTPCTCILCHSVCRNEKPTSFSTTPPHHRSHLLISLP